MAGMKKHGGTEDQTPQVPRSTLAKRLVEAREEVRPKLTQEQLAVELEISTRQIARYEAGEHAPSRATLIAWADVTETDFWWLSGETPPADDLERRRSARRTRRPTDRYVGRRFAITLVAA